MVEPDRLRDDAAATSLTEYVTHFHFVNHSRIRGVPVHIDHSRARVTGRSKRFAEECSRRRQTASLRKKEVNGCTRC